MSGIRSKDTKPEMIVRKGLHRLGFRFRLHDRKLPGRPDLVFPKYRAVIFVHGCFWHGHECHLFKWPKTREDFWRQKIARNISNDEKAKAALEQAGWRVITIWECSTKGHAKNAIDEAIRRLADWIRSSETVTAWGR